MRERGFATDTSQGFQNVREALLFNRLRLFAFQNKVQEFLYLYASHLDLFKGVKQSDVVYFRNRVGILPPESYVLSYYGQQVVDYDQDRFIEFVKNHSVEEIAEEEENFIHFKPEFPLEEVVEEIKKYIPSKTRKNGKYITNEYLFRYSGCGALDGNECDYFIVTTLNDSDHFMTMHPVSELGDVGYVDLNYLKNKGEAQVKSLSRIDRFNRRYRNVLNVETG